MADSVPIPEIDAALGRINAALARLKDARAFHTVPGNIPANQLDGVIRGLEFSKYLVTNGGQS